MEYSKNFSVLRQKQLTHTIPPRTRRRPDQNSQEVMDNTRNILEQVAFNFDARYVDALRSELGESRVDDITSALSRWTPPDAAEREQIVSDLERCGMTSSHAEAIVSSVLEFSRKVNLSCWSCIAEPSSSPTAATTSKQQPQSPTGVLHGFPLIEP